MNVDACLERIGYSGELRVDEQTLRNLHRAFILAVPFENLDIHLGRHIAFTQEAVFRKVVHDNRGGFCYELNSLFYDLLKSIGFDVTFHGARMMRDGRPGVPMGHMVLAVRIDGRTWLADVGNGKSTREPVCWDGGNETTAEGVHYQIRQEESGLVLFETGEDRQWKPRFLIDPEPKQREHFIHVCEWTQTSKESRFTQVRLCTIAKPNGRVLLMDNKLTVNEADKTEEREVAPDEYSTCLHTYFGVAL
jgi:N-hydroxyarylamine O-acetyltransferase